MSTIAEVRAQARETLADYNRVNAGGYGAGNHTYLARALRALLDATEPPAHDEACEADWGPEGQESPCRCGEWRPSDSCPHENFTSLHSGLGMVRMTCHDCGETVEAISATAQDDIEERSTR